MHLYTFAGYIGCICDLCARVHYRLYGAQIKALARGLDVLVATPGRLAAGRPPPRYNEGTLVDAMQKAWRFVEDAALRERLKEAKGNGTPATRAGIIKGLKRQNLLAADGKLVLPTPAGLQLFELLRGAAPALVDPGTTALWEMHLDEVVTGRADFRAVIDGIGGHWLRALECAYSHSWRDHDAKRSLRWCIRACGPPSHTAQRVPNRVFQYRIRRSYPFLA
jgi:hypothetical protein